MTPRQTWRRLATLLFLSLLLPGLAPAADEDELLAPEQAFQLSVSALGADRIAVDYRIAEGYYLYRERFSFAAETEGYTLGTPVFPQGKIKHDEFFGEVEIYRHGLRIEIPVSGQGPALKLKAVSQGCADLGVCYPPLTQRAVLNLPKAAAAPVSPQTGAPADKSADALKALSNLTGGLNAGQPELLPPDEAFRFDIIAQDANTLIARWEVAEGYYLYRDKIKLVAEGGQGLRLGEPILPAGKMIEDPYFGRMEIFPHAFEAVVPVLRGDGSGSQLTVLAEYQGCADVGVCYPPVKKRVELTLPTAGATAAAAPAGTVKTAPAPQAAAGEQLSEQDAIAQRLASGSTLLTLLAFFGFGLLLAFTPCVFPMIPILSGIIIGQGERISTRKAFALSLAYVLAMALTYAIAGVIVGKLGNEFNIQIWFQNPWVLSVFAAVFVLLSLSMFGFYDLQMPASIQGRLSQISNTQEGGSLIGAGLMGVLSALIVGPCVTAPLIGALIYISQTQDAVLGFFALLALGLGMGAPLLLIGTSAGKLLPRAGAWMDVTKAVFGVLLLGVAIWMLERILPGAVTLALWAVLLIVSGVYMGALETLREGASNWFRLWKGLGLIILIWGALLLVGAAGGGRDVLQPLKGVVAMGGTGQAARHDELAFRQVKGIAGLEQALASAKAARQPVMLDFYADWCISCKEMEKFTFGDARVQAALEGALLLQTDVTANDAEDQALLKRFGLFGPPAILFFTPAGQELKNYRVVGHMPPETFEPHVRKALNK